MKSTARLCRLATTALLLPLLLDAGWTALGPFGGSAALVRVDPHEPQTVIAASSNALLYRSTDGGASWEPLPFPHQLRAVVHALDIDPDVRGVWLAGMSPERRSVSGMLRSTDGGASWRPVEAFRGLQVRAIARFRGDSRVMAAGADAGVFLSRDGGLEWVRISPAEHSELQPVVSVAIDPKDRHIIYAGTPHLPWKTVDGGATWQSIHSGMIDDSDVFSILVDRNRPQRIFASACSGIYRSFDRGGAWVKLRGSARTSYRTYTIVQDPQFENVLFAGATLGMIRSPDGGVTWERIGPYSTRSIAFDMRRLGRIYIATDEAGILRSDDSGTTWEPVNRGFCNRRLTPLTIDGAGAMFTSTVNDSAGGGLFRLGPEETEWSKEGPEPRVTGEALITHFDSPPFRTKAAISFSRAMVVAGDPVTVRASLSFPRDSGLAELLAPPWRLERIVALASSVLSVSGDSGATWRESEVPGGEPIHALAELDPPWVAALGRSTVFLSRDGENWTACARPPRRADVYGIVPLPGRRLLLATSAGLQVSSDFGRSWQPVRGPMDGNTVQAICRHPLRPSVLFLATYGVVYRSDDAGLSWREISPRDWPVGSLVQLAVVPGSPDRLFALTRQQGVFTLPVD